VSLQRALDLAVHVPELAVQAGYCSRFLNADKDVNGLVKRSAGGHT
jgi:hypothetical protein